MAEETKEFDFVEEYQKWGKENQSKVFEDDVIKMCFSDLNKNINDLMSSTIVKTFEEVFLYAYQKGYEDCKKEMEGK